MNEKDLVRQLKMLRGIKPRKDWVILTKQQILRQAQEAGPERSFGLFSPFLRYKLAFSPIISVLIIIGLFGFAQQTVPGDLFFSLKQATETVQVGFSSAVEKPKLQLQFANKRLEDIGKIAEANQVENLAPAIKAFQANISQAAKNLAVIEAAVTSSDLLLIKELVEETQKLEENKQKVEALGVEIGETVEFDNALAQLAQRELEYLESRTLTESQQEFLSEAKAAFERGDYSQSLYKIWLLYNKK